MYRYPPYIPDLALSVLAAGHGGESEFSTASYYPRLFDLLGERPVPGGYPHFDQLRDVWLDLERWANIDERGRLGTFRVLTTSSNRVHVGIPIAQTLLAEREREALKRAFAAVGLQPSFPPVESVLGAIALKHVGTDLRPRTRRLLHPDTPDEELRIALLEAISDELEDWDGVAVARDDGDALRRSRSGALALSLHVPLLGAPRVSLRCVASGTVPEEGWDVVVPKLGRGACVEAAAGWSTAVEADDGALSPALLDWTSPITAADDGHGVTFRRAGSRVVLFVSGESVGVDGYVESNRLPLGEPFFVAVEGASSAAVEEWGSASCDGFKGVFAQSLPEGWGLYRADAARSDEGVGMHFSALSAPETVQLSLVGGVRLGRTAEYFSFSPPSLRVQSARPVTVRVGSTVVGEAVETGTLSIPPAVLSAGAIRVEVVEGDEVVKAREFFVHDEFALAPSEGPQFNVYGEVSGGANGTVYRGVTVHPTPPSPRSFNVLPELPSFTSRRVVLLGRGVGEVAVWPKEPLPTGWAAIWTVPVEKRGRAAYCGPTESVPSPQRRAGANLRKAKEWKKWLYQWRKKIDPPRQNGLGKAWKEYVSFARNV
ncbi:hypothetical protein B1759_16680 [Rubrivirga sp. SAORIC476]|nr:hypothetical protein B1759_16680 [Rubrivirga sp. SAORIC476]